MTHNAKEPWIVVGVSPSGDHDAALEYAAAEAARRGCGIHLVLVMHPRALGLDEAIELKLLGEDLVRVDTELLVECEKWLSDRIDGTIRVTTEVVHGKVVPSLVAAGRDAQLIVLQHHRMARAFHLPTLSVTNGVASRASAPVVAVPDTWHEAEAGDAPVVAAVESVESSWNVARTAFEAAAQRSNGGVRLTRAWSYWDDLEPEEAALRARSPREWEDHLRDGIDEGFAPLMTEYPEVACETRVDHGQPTYVLVSRSEEASLVVIGRHHPLHPVGSHLGPITRAVLTHACCPVMVVGTRADVASREVSVRS